MKYVGKVGVKVVPDTKEFRTTVQRLEAQRHKTVFDILVDARRAHAEQRAFDKKWNMKEIRRDVVADTKKAKAELKALMAGDGRKLLRVEVTDEALNATKAKIKALDERLGRFRKYKVDTADTIIDLELANRELNRLEKARKVQLDVAQAKAKLEPVHIHVRHDGHTHGNADQPAGNKGQQRLPVKLAAHRKGRNDLAGERAKDGEHGRQLRLQHPGPE